MPQSGSSPTLSPEVAAFLLNQVNGLTLNVGAPDFDEALAKVLAARQQLTAIVQATPPAAE